MARSQSLKQKLALIEQHNQRSLYITWWRSSLILGLFGSLVWIATLSCWQITTRSQIKVEGRNLVSEAVIDKLLDFPFPKPIWAIDSRQLTKKLESVPSIEVARVNRQIVPPQLNVSIEERTPVALALSSGRVGFLDRQGQWIDRRFYGELNTSFPLPQLKVINYQAQYRNSWIKIYRLLSRNSTIGIKEVRWDEANNLFLKTAIGTIYLGSDLSRLERQFEIMVRLKNLPAHFQRSKIAYIDLSNPNSSLIQKYQ